MPDRILRSDILTSERMNAISWPAEVFYRRLMSVADDYGRYDGRPSILRAALYALKLDKVSEPDVGKWIRECDEAGLVRCYTVESKPYLEIKRFGQRTRTASKWPDPPAASGGNPPQPAATCGNPPPISDADSYAKSNAKEASPPCAESSPTEIVIPNSGEGQAFVVWFLDLLAKTGAPNTKLSPAIKENWAKCYEDMLRIDGRTKEQIKAVCTWARNDEFWCKNFLSPAKLRDRKDGVQWFDAFTAKMNNAKPAKSADLPWGKI